MVLRLPVKLLMVLLLFFQGSIAYAKTPVLDTDPGIPKTTPTESPEKIENNPLRPTFTAQVSESQYLPPALYGTWQVKGRIISTNSVNRFKNKTYDIWVLQQAGNKIRLANPDTQTETFITVNKVINNHATFTVSTRPNKKYLQYEQIKLIVAQNTFQGTSVLRIQHVKTGLVEQALFQLFGTKLSGPSPELQIDASKQR